MFPLSALVMLMLLPPPGGALTEIHHHHHHHHHHHYEGLFCTNYCILHGLLLQVGLVRMFVTVEKQRAFKNNLTESPEGRR